MGVAWGSHPRNLNGRSGLASPGGSLAGHTERDAAASRRRVSIDIVRRHAPREATPLLEWLTPAERRGASVLVVILLAGALHDAWSIWSEGGPARAAAPVADNTLAPTESRAVLDTAATATPATPRGLLIDLNRAETPELESLPGIGPVLARRILEQRRRVGAFHRVDDLLAVRGVGPRLFSRLQPLVTVSTAPRMSGAAPGNASGMHSAPSRASERADSASASRTLSR